MNCEYLDRWPRLDILIVIFFDRMIIVVYFYDVSGNLVDTVDTPFKEAEKVKSGFLLGSTVSDKNNIKIADVQLVNKNNMVIAQDEAQL